MYTYDEKRNQTGSVRTSYYDDYYSVAEYDVDSKELFWCTYNYDGSVWEWEEYKYDSTGTRAGSIRTKYHSWDNSKTVTEYDGNGNQISEKEYDANGNLISSN